jgi:hypothetical protein
MKWFRNWQVQKVSNANSKAKLNKNNHSLAQQDHKTPTMKPSSWAFKQGLKQITQYIQAIFVFITKANKIFLILDCGWAQKLINII